MSNALNQQASNTLNQTANTINQVSESFNQVKDKIMENLRNVSGTVMLYGMYAIIIACAIIYYFYITRLPEKQCDLFTEIYSKPNSYITNMVASDTDLLKDFYIKSAYNCCSGGTYKNDYVSLCVLKNVLLQGVRVLDFEIYSVNDQPVVATSSSDSFHIKETFNSINFAEVMQVLDDNAFIFDGGCPNPKDPLILHLRIKSANNKMYKKLADILQASPHILGKQYSYFNHDINLCMEPVKNIMGKIVITVDSTNSAAIDNEDLREFINIPSNSTYMRALNYNDMKYSPDIDEQTQYNLQYGFTLVMPDKGVNPSNPSRILCHDNGSNMVAMRYQLFDEYLEENEEFFNNAGFAFVKKPNSKISKPVKIEMPEKLSKTEEMLLSPEPRNVDLGFYKFQI